MSSSKKLTQSEEGSNISILNLPESILDCILKHLSPIELCRMSEVCTSFRDICRRDDLWQKHIKHKWGRVVGDNVYKEWQWHIATAKREDPLNQHIDQNGSLGSFSGTWPYVCLESYLEDGTDLSGLSSNNFMMSLYLSLETGRFWFPAQVYKSHWYCYYALVSYDSKTDTFQARQQYGGWRIIGTNIQWDAVRVPPVETPPFVLHVSDCLDNLKPGDHIEIQWRASREIPYDWWYAVIGHFEQCDKNKNHCQCHYSELVVLEFKQYSPIFLSKKDYWKQYHRMGGFYGGIRKIDSEEEIETWNSKLCQTQPLVRHDYI